MLEVRDLTVRFPSGFVAVHGANVKVRPGEILALCGPNGAGKSTVLSVLAGDRAPSLGVAELDGRPLGAFDARGLARRRAVLEQSPSLSAPYTVERLAGLSIGVEVPPGLMHDIVHRSLEDVGLANIKDKRADLLSGGERHRAHLARILAQLAAAGEVEGKYLLLDEPTASLDIEHQISVLKIARRAADNGVGVLIVLHDLNLAAAFAHQVGLMNRGRMVSTGRPPDVFSKECLSEVYRTPIEVESDGRGRIRIAPLY
ncbi:MAG: ATP-binding cassette domain-containing protein [Rhodospirillales bacterium]|nr:ATP-binding cassette domain-containing protein [Rhodospirillales bacterium]